MGGVDTLVCPVSFKGCLGKRRLHMMTAAAGVAIVNRRTFLNLLSTLLHAAVAVCVVIPGLRFLTGVRQRRKSGEGLFVRVAKLSDLTPRVPVRVVIRRDRRDAYIQYPPGPIGAVWLVHENDDPEATGEPPRLRCLQTICPHLGCAIDFAAERDGFVCPCHASEFSRSGVPRFGPSPRPMDELRCRVSEPDAAGYRWVEVEYREFRTGVPNQEAIA